MVTLRSVWLNMEDDVAAGNLLEISRKHCKLALEHGDKYTSSERREAIKVEIELLRVRRHELISNSSNANVSGEVVVHESLK